MEFREVVRRRRMVRNFDPDRPVEPDVLERILEHALHAPSAGFSQGWGFLVLTAAEDRARFWQVTTENADEAEDAAAADAPAENAADAGAPAPDPWLRSLSRAPVLIVALSCKRAYLDRYAEADKGWTDRDEAHWPVPYWDIDTGMASLLMLLTITDEGLGGVFFGVPPERIEPFRQAFGVPADHQPIGVIALGHRAPDRRSPSLKRGRRDVEEVVHRGRW